MSVYRSTKHVPRRGYLEFLYKVRVFDSFAAPKLTFSLMVSPTVDASCPAGLSMSSGVMVTGMPPGFQPAPDLSTRPGDNLHPNRVVGTASEEGSQAGSFSTSTLEWGPTQSSVSKTRCTTSLSDVVL